MSESKTKPLDWERQDVSQRAYGLYLYFKDHSYFTASEAVTIRWTTEPTTGPRLLRLLRRKWHESQEVRKVFYLNPSDNTVLMMDDGKLALRDEKTKRFATFDFATASSADFDIVRAAVHEGRKMI